MKDKQYRAIFNIVSGKSNDLLEIDDAVIQEVKKQKIVDPILKHDLELNIRNMDWSTLSCIKDQHLKEIKILIKEFENYNVNYLLIKGIAMTQYYPDGVPRQNHDYDFILKDISDFWVCHNILKELGYQEGINPVLTTFRGGIKGIVKYNKKIDANLSLELEFNIAGFIISEVTWFDDSSIWEHTHRITYKDLEFNVPNASTSLIILIAEMCDRKEFLIRDMMDFHFLTNNSKLDWKYIDMALSDRYLNEILIKMKINQQLMMDQFVYKKIKNNKLYMEFKHILPFIFNSKNKIKKIHFRYLKYIGDILSSKGKMLRLVRQFDNIMSPKSRFDNGITTHFILMNNKFKGDLKWLKYKKYWLLITPIGTYWASNFAILEEEEEEDIKEYLSNLKENNRVE